LSKTAALVNNIHTIEFIESETEFEAVILEADLIKKFRPKYNIIMKDDKSFLYIVIRQFKVKDRKFLRVETARESDLPKLKLKKAVFGPYPDGKTAKYILRMLRKVFPYADCSEGKYSRYTKLGIPCLFGHLGLCYSPCVDVSAENLAKVDKSISSIKNILQGKSSRTLKSLHSKMGEYSKDQKFEEAAKLRDIISKFDYLRQGFNLPDNYIDNPYLVEDIAKEAMKEIKNFLPILYESPGRVECYDISNISGKDAVSSMVVAVDGRLKTAEYRKFKIRLKNEPNDFMMMKETLSRRLKCKDWDLPDLIVLDGGRGQLSVVLNVLTELGMQIPCVGLAKKTEKLVYRINDVFHELKVPTDNVGMKLLINLRNESHRFAQAYHHQLRLKSIK